MTHDELFELIADVQQLQSELDDIEVKAAQGGTPQRLYEPLSAFANRNGGVILFGLDESRDFEIRLFADRLEIQSPGGLYGNVSVEALEEEQSTRNRVLMRLMEDLHLVENRGSGIRTMLEAMHKANLEPPRFQDKRSSFWVTFRNHTLMNPQAIAWLNQFANHPLNDHQRLALVYLRHNEQMTNSDYQRLNHVDSVTANRELRGLVQSGLTKQHSTRRWAHYTLNVPAAAKVMPPSLSNEEKVLAYVREHGSISNAECCYLLGVQPSRAWYLLKKLCTSDSLKPKGHNRWVRYVLPY